jgi:recombination DNA repair RAD52 pathway protein
MDKMHQDPPLPPAPISQRFNDTNSHHNNIPNNTNTPNSTHNNKKNQQQHHHQQRKSSRNITHMSDQMAASLELSISPNVPPAPAAGMYWSRAITYGRSPSRPLRAHSSNLIGEHLYIFGGCDMKTCFNSLYVLDMG